MKIMFVIKSMAPLGGAEHVLADLITFISEGDHEISLITLDEKGDSAYTLPDSLRWEGLGLNQSGISLSPSTSFQAVKELRRHLRAQRPNVAVGVMHSSFIPLGLAARSCGIPAIACEHGPWELYRGHPLQKLLLFGSRWTCAASSVPTLSAKNTFPAFIANRQVVIPNNVDIQPLSKIEPLPSTQERQMVLSVGRLVPQKDFPTLISAFRSVADEFPAWDLVIIGDGDERQSLTSQIRSVGLEDRVFLPGTAKDIGRYFHHAELFVLPSVFESFGIAACEAMAHGTATVAFADCAGLNEIIDHNEDGFLVEPSYDRVDNLARAISMLMGSPDRRRELGERAIHSIQRFSIEHIGPKFLEFISMNAKYS